MPSHGVVDVFREIVVCDQVIKVHVGIVSHEEENARTQKLVVNIFILRTVNIMPLMWPVDMPLIDQRLLVQSPGLRRPDAS
jgi:hypothetical protein